MSTQTTDSNIHKTLLITFLYPNWPPMCISHTTPCPFLSDLTSHHHHNKPLMHVCAKPPYAALGYHLQ